MRTVVSALALILAAGSSMPAAEIFVSPGGADTNPGTRARPLRTLVAAQNAVRKAHRDGPVTVYFRAGVYYLPETVVFAAQDSGSREAPVVYAAYPGEEAVLSGGVRMRLRWRPYRGGIWQASVPAGFDTDQLFVNGQLQPMARYPNFDSAAQYFDGWAADAVSRERAARWHDPRGGIIHAMHRALWGDMHWVITGKDNSGNLTYEGGWQNNRPAPMHEKYRFVENIFEELDAPGEWFLDRNAATLFYYPAAGVNLQEARIEGVRLTHLIEFRGTEQNPVRFVTLRGFTFTHTSRTFMENREPLLRSDWTTYRGGAIFFNGCEDCTLEDAAIDQVGGTAVFVNKYNRRVTVLRCHISRAGANGVAFVGDPDAVRSPHSWSRTLPFAAIDRTPGPRTNNYPADCVVEDCLIHETGRVEKQTAPVQISMSMGITVRHCSIYDVPRAGINISEGTWGGHVVEFCDVFDTVKETGDHGSFNSWGRDRYWGLKDVDLNTILLGENAALPFLDMVQPNILRNNRWRCDHGWDIDLDDGSSRYEIRDNLSLNGGIKLREGFRRVVENNVIVGNSFHPHVWYSASEDTFRRNIVSGQYRPIRVPAPWGKECDYNLLHRPGQAAVAPAGVLRSQSGLDVHSVEGDAMFVDPARGDYRVKEGSPALVLGFRNFPMDQFGVRTPRLKAIARTPRLPGLDDSSPVTLRSARDAQSWTWAGGRVRNVIGIGEVSASGLPGETGVIILDAPSDSAIGKAGARKGDVILRIDGEAVGELRDLQRIWRARMPGPTPEVTLYREQREYKIPVPADTR